MRPLAELGAAVTLLTRLPGGMLVRGDWPSAERCVWAYPLVGLLVGGLGAAVFWGARSSGVPALPASALALSSTAVLTGGLHEDGLADTFDALGVGGTVERRLAIMRDSRIGAHGALALGLSLLVRVGALSALPAGGGATALLVAGLLGRASMLVVIGRAAPARDVGLASPLGRTSGWRLGVGLLVAVGIAALLDVGWGRAVVGAGLVGLTVAALARSRFGGYTGDVLGASAVLAECASLLACVAA